MNLSTSEWSRTLACTTLFCTVACQAEGAGTQSGENHAGTVGSETGSLSLSSATDGSATSGSVGSSGITSEVSTGESSVEGSGDDSATPGEGACGLEQPAFCETFEIAHPGGRGGDLDETVWGASRWGHDLGRWYTRELAHSDERFDFPARYCGMPFRDIAVGDDYRLCPGRGVDGQTSGQLHEVLHDTGDFGINSMMIRQPFDFAGRTGKVVFDVDAKFNPYTDGHGWWVEFWITEDPIPLPYHDAPSVNSTPRNSLGLAFMGTKCDKAAWMNSLTHVFVSQDHRVLHEIKRGDWQCFQTADAALNHFEIQVSQDHVEIWVSDANSGAEPRMVARVEELDLNFSRGFISLQHSHYNAAKAEATPSQSYRWDNIGFDGPRLPRVAAHEIEDPVEVFEREGKHYVRYGFNLEAEAPTEFAFEGVDLAAATRASFNLTVISPSAEKFSYRVNEGPWQTFRDPTDHERYEMRAYAIPLELTALHNGTNTISLTAPMTPFAVVGNLDLSTWSSL